jgi:hypothetical protein
VGDAPYRGVIAVATSPIHAENIKGPYPLDTEHLFRAPRSATRGEKELVIDSQAGTSTGSFANTGSRLALKWSRTSGFLPGGPDLLRDYRGCRNKRCSARRRQTCRHHRRASLHSELDVFDGRAWQPFAAAGFSRWFRGATRPRGSIAGAPSGQQADRPRPGAPSTRLGPSIDQASLR